MLFMTPTVLKNLFSKSATRLYPKEVRPPFENNRGELVNDIDTCIFCSICQMKCPSQCITVDKKAATWECDPFACVYCGICVEHCPTNSLSQKLLYRPSATEREHIFMKGTPKPPKKKADEAGDKPKDEPKAEAKAEPKAEAKEEPKAKKAKPAAKKTDAKAEAKAEAKPKAKAKAKAKPKAKKDAGKK